jgi:hypothetical protein
MQIIPLFLNLTEDCYFDFLILVEYYYYYYYYPINLNYYLCFINYSFLFYPDFINLIITIIFITIKTTSTTTTTSIINVLN